MYHVAAVDWSFPAESGAFGPNARGLGRSVLVGPATGAVHTELSIVKFEPAGWLARHVHSFEEAIYVLAGELVVEHDGRFDLLTAGDFSLFPIGVWHSLGNPGTSEARLLSVNTPQRLGADAGRRDTFFAPDAGPPPGMQSAQPPNLQLPTARLVGRYEGTPPQLEALAIADPGRGRTPIGMDSALLAYSGISVKMLVDRTFGADLLTMFTVDYEVGGAAQPHDHPFEEAYFFLSGEVVAELDGKERRLGPGSALWAGVGSSHAFYNDGPDRVRWIETQAPQPPARHSYRWLAPWRRMESNPGQ